MSSPSPLGKQKATEDPDPPLPRSPILKDDIEDMEEFEQLVATTKTVSAMPLAKLKYLGEPLPPKSLANPPELVSVRKSPQPTRGRSRERLLQRSKVRFKPIAPQGSRYKLPSAQKGTPSSESKEDSALEYAEILHRLLTVAKKEVKAKPPVQRRGEVGEDHASSDSNVKWCAEQLDQLITEAQTELPLCNIMDKHKPPPRKSVKEKEEDMTDDIQIQRYAEQYDRGYIYRLGLDAWIAFPAYDQADRDYIDRKFVSEERASAEMRRAEKLKKVQGTEEAEKRKLARWKALKESEVEVDKAVVKLLEELSLTEAHTGG